MKRTLLLFLVLINLGALSSQTHTSAFFLYRNDGSVHPFFFEDVDSIRYSHIDIDSIERPDYVVTELWTPDSVYRIPIEVIDSISFTTPSEIRKSGSVEITGEQIHYLLDVDSLTLKFSSAIPSDLIPKQGSKLTYTDWNVLFPNGFIGQVREVIPTPESITVVCDSIGMGDAFERYYQVGEFVSTDNGNSRNLSRSVTGEVKKIPLEPYKYRPDFNYSSYFHIVPNDRFQFGYSQEGSTNLEMTPGGKYVVIFNDCYSEPTVSVNFDLKVLIENTLNIGGNFEIDLFELPGLSEVKGRFPLPVPAVGALVNVVVEPVFTITGSGAYSRFDSYTADCGFRCTISPDPNIGTSIKLKTPDYYEPINETRMLTGDITVFAGIFLGIKAGRKELIELSGGASLGIENSTSLDIGLDEFRAAENNSEVYELNLSKEESWSVVFKPKIEARFAKFFSFGLEGSVKLGEISATNGAKAIFPKFTQPKYINNEAESFISFEVYNETALSVLPGIKVVNEYNVPLFKMYFDKVHKTELTRVELPYFHKEYNRKCRICPIVEYCGHEITGSPTIEIIIYEPPVTDNARAGIYDAIVNGHLNLDEDQKDMDVSGWKVGFYYSTDSENVINGNYVETYLQSDKTFSANIDDLSPDTDYYYCAYLEIEDQIFYGDVCHFTTQESEVIDLGLSVLWRGWNVGASHKHEVGDHFAWGESKRKSIYDWLSYFDNPYTETLEWKGCEWNSDISGIDERDPSIILEGGPWRMPSREEMKELVEKCRWVWTSVNSVNGYKVIGPNGHSIFLPATGLCDGIEITNVENYGAYWTSTPQVDTDGKATAATLYFYGSMLKSLQWANRCHGRAIRPVRDKTDY